MATPGLSHSFNAEPHDERGSPSGHAPRLGLRRYLPGLLLAAFLAAAGLVLGSHLPTIGAVAGSLLLGLLAGTVAGGTLKHYDAQLSPGLGAAAKPVLEVAVVFLGFGISSDSLAVLSTTNLLGLASAMMLALGLAMLGSRLLGLSKNTGWLLGIGCAICGSAAIAAAAPATDASDDEVCVAVATINFVGIVALFVAPSLLAALSMPNVSSAWILGGSLPALGHVVASGFYLGDTAGETATVIKMGRVLFLVPLALLLPYVSRKLDGGRARIPLFSLCFVFAVIVAVSGLMPETTSAKLGALGKLLLCVSMAAIGSKMRLGRLLSRAPKAAIVVGLTLLAQAALFAALHSA
jgi:uncharacterized integral membrane protein (TIGR00698 family)